MQPTGGAVAHRICCTEIAKVVALLQGHNYMQVSVGCIKNAECVEILMNHGADLATVTQTVRVVLKPSCLGKNCVFCLLHPLKLDLVCVMHQLLATLIAQGAYCDIDLQYPCSCFSVKLR